VDTSENSADLSFCVLDLRDGGLVAAVRDDCWLDHDHLSLNFDGDLTADVLVSQFLVLIHVDTRTFAPKRRRRRLRRRG
jgi:hypothetical protein